MQTTSIRMLSLLFFVGCLPVFRIAPIHAAEDDTSKPPELKVLERLVGRWNSETVSRVAEWTPKETRATGVLTREWVLDGRFVQENSKQSDTDAIVMFTYDSSKKEYRWWMFNAKGHAMEMAGQWDEPSKTFSFKADLGNGLVNTSTMHFIDNDMHKWRASVKDRQGKLYFDAEGTCKRTK